MGAGFSGVMTGYMLNDMGIEWVLFLFGNLDIILEISSLILGT